MAVLRLLLIGQPHQHHILLLIMKQVDHVPVKVCAIDRLLTRKYVNIKKRKKPKLFIIRQTKFYKKKKIQKTKKQKSTS